MSSALANFLPTDVVGIALSIALLVVVYYAYHVVCWYKRILVIGREVDKLPGDKVHWLYGSLAEVYTVLKYK